MSVLGGFGQLRKPAGSNGGSDEMPDRRDCGEWIQPGTVSGRWKEKSSRERGSVSRPFMNREICPVLARTRRLGPGVRPDAQDWRPVQGSTVSTPVFRNSAGLRVTMARPRTAAAAARKASGT